MNLTKLYHTSTNKLIVFRRYKHNRHACYVLDSVGSSQGSPAPKPCNLKMQKKESKYPLENTLNLVYVNYQKDSYFLEASIQ